MDNRADLSQGHLKLDWVQQVHLQRGSTRGWGGGMVWKLAAAEEFLASLSVRTWGRTAQACCCARMHRHMQLMHLRHMMHSIPSCITPLVTHAACSAGPKMGGRWTCFGCVGSRAPSSRSSGLPVAAASHAHPLRLTATICSQAQVAITRLGKIRARRACAPCAMLTRMYVHVYTHRYSEQARTQADTKLLSALCIWRRFRD